MSGEISQKTARLLLKTLKDAEEHLDYCGWGDSWERSTMGDLDKRVAAAIAAGEAES